MAPSQSSGSNSPGFDLTPRQEDARFHHIGFVVSSIELTIESFERSLGAAWDGKIFEDPLQGVKVAFLSTGSGDVEIELVEPAGEGSPVSRFLSKSGGGLHHLCYMVDNLDLHLSEMRRLRATIVRKPQPAVAFAGRRIAWVITAEKLLLEFIERRLPGGEKICEPHAGR
jgi:methylmalonyl-CoA/ethylmalonyl-CoA epimerase